MMQIDDHDLKILTLLQTNGRLTHQERSYLMGLPALLCSCRRIQLEQANLILGYHARVAPEAVGLGMIGLFEVRLLNHTPDNVMRFHRRVAEQRAIVDAYKTTGDADYLLKVAVASLAELSTLIRELVAGYCSVAQVKTPVVLNRLKGNGLMIAMHQQAGRYEERPD